MPFDKDAYITAALKGDYDRITRRDKLFMMDTGLMSFLLGWRFGKIRTFVFNQLTAILKAQEEDAEIYYYRDHDKREIDFVIQNNAG